ncbi:MAG TPA: carbohydrate ABC transporter permease [Aggregatilinea sp.]|jgi:ABC-type glycerol-3-phosphate transport system permease component|uniref:carbohydrate ABC transporter permease n=1 Tax=Aggregatilinea sp. TaxID=2806333 RepID=UPI002CF9AED5|nr:carbohydrate ABC transporter permease [Aggregatilinea sp.]HML20636.1 carbohydrate ABC transporter permease [Aggregatilinea sp.]
MTTQPLVERVNGIGRERRSWLERHSGKIAVYLALVVFVIFICFPFYYIVMSSITPRTDLFNIPPSYWPSSPTLENYRHMINAVPFLTYLRNSLIFAVGSSVVSVIASAMAAYALARIKFPGSNIVYMLLVMSSALPQIAVLVPMFETFQSFSLINTHQGLIILMSSLLMPFSILILVSFIMQIPVEIEEAALIDGANIVQVLTRMMVPLLLPALSTMTMINFIISWNELLYPLVFAQRDVTKTLSVALVELSSDASTYTRPWDMLSALSVFMVIPVLLLVLAGQRMIIAGLSRGAVK